MTFKNIQQTKKEDSENFSSALQILFDSLLKFLNAFQIQSARNKYRIHLAITKIPGQQQSQLIFPLTETMDHQSLQKFAFETVRETIYQRITDIITYQTETDLNLSSPKSELNTKFTNISSAFLKSICYANKQKQTQRILIIQTEKDDPKQYNSIVNGLFACQKMNLVIDCLVLNQTFGQYQHDRKVFVDEQEKRKRIPVAPEQKGANIAPSQPYLMIQGAQMTNGIFREMSGNWCKPGKVGSTIILFELINNFLPSPGARQILRIPGQMELSQMSTTCVCHPEAKEQQIGYMCQGCLAIHCLQPTLKQLHTLDEVRRKVRKEKQTKEQEKEYLKNNTWPKLNKIEKELNQKKCHNCGKTFCN